jgi:hypothetical protein
MAGRLALEVVTSSILRVALIIFADVPDKADYDRKEAPNNGYMIFDLISKEK